MNSRSRASVRFSRATLGVLTGSLLALALAACDDGPQRDEHVSTVSEGPGASALGTRRREVRFGTRDGVLLNASLTVPRRQAPAVILVHHFASDRHDWDGFVPVLDRAGFATFAYDTRGMGRSLSRWPSKRRYFPPRDEGRYLDEMPRDLAAAIRFVRTRRNIDSKRVAVVGASHGANVAYASSTRHRAGRPTVALSPVRLGDVLRPRRRPARGVLFISSRLEAAAVHELSRAVVEPTRTMLARDPEAHGVALLREPAVRRAVLAWLREQVLDRDQVSDAD